MIVVVDVNIILSALIKDSTTRELIINSGQEFCFPEHSLGKIRKYQGLILQKSGLSETEFQKILSTIFSYIKIIPTEEIFFCWEEAKKVMEDIDPEDVTIIATALSQTNSIIWSDDSDFEKQDAI